MPIFFYIRKSAFLIVSLFQLFLRIFNSLHKLEGKKVRNEREGMPGDLYLSIISQPSMTVAW